MSSRKRGAKSDLICLSCFKEFKSNVELKWHLLFNHCAKQFKGNENENHKDNLTSREGNSSTESENEEPLNEEENSNAIPRDRKIIMELGFEESLNGKDGSDDPASCDEISCTNRSDSEELPNGNDNSNLTSRDGRTIMESDSEEQLNGNDSSSLPPCDRSSCMKSDFSDHLSESDNSNLQPCDVIPIKNSYLIDQPHEKENRFGKLRDLNTIIGSDSKEPLNENNEVGTNHDERRGVLGKKPRAQTVSDSTRHKTPNEGSQCKKTSKKKMPLTEHYNNVQDKTKLPETGKVSEPKNQISEVSSKAPQNNDNSKRDETTLEQRFVKCGYCIKMFISPKSLKRHYEIFHPEIEYQPWQQPI